MQGSVSEITSLIRSTHDVHITTVQADIEA